jgi:hypothetical protein
LQCLGQWLPSPRLPGARFLPPSSSQEERCISFSGSFGIIFVGRRQACRFHHQYRCVMARRLDCRVVELINPHASSRLLTPDPTSPRLASPHPVAGFSAELSRSKSSRRITRFNAQALPSSLLQKPSGPVMLHPHLHHLILTTPSEAGGGRIGQEPRPEGALAATPVRSHARPYVWLTSVHFRQLEVGGMCGGQSMWLLVTVEW